MNLRIAGYVAGSLLLEQEPDRWRALVMLDTGARATEFVPGHTRSHLFLQFDDIESPELGRRAPRWEQVAEGLRFAHGKDNLLVCCHAGRGRSAAMAYLICCQERGVSEAVGLFDPTRHRPNRLVIRLGDALLGNPQILDRFDAWRKAHANIKLSDYYDQLEEEYEELMAQGASDRITGG